MLSVVVGCFIVELFFSAPSGLGILSGLVPQIPAGALLVAVGMFGATVMPHNLYLHSSVVKRAPGLGVRRAYRWAIADMAIALNGAAFVNASIVIVSAATFFTQGVEVTEIQQAHELLEQFLGPAAGVIFGLGLLCSGQSSAIAGTMAGQIVMEGFVGIKVRPWIRRLITRSIAIVPAAVVVAVSGSSGTYQLLILSQVILSLQLPFAVIPLIRFARDKTRMGEMQSPIWVTIISCLCALLIIVLNVALVVTKLIDWVGTGSTGAWVAVGFAIPLSLFLLFLMGYTAFVPIKPIIGYNSVEVDELLER